MAFLGFVLMERTFFPYAYFPLVYIFPPLLYTLYFIAKKNFKGPVLLYGLFRFKEFFINPSGSCFAFLQLLSARKETEEERTTSI